MSRPPVDTILKKIREEYGEPEGFEIELDLRLLETDNTGFAAGAGHVDPASNSLSLHIFNVTTGCSKPVAVVRFRPKQWEKLKEVGDGLIKALTTDQKLEKH